METENKNNQKDQNKQNDNNSSSGKSKSDSSSGIKESVLTLLQPHDMSKTVESALHVMQGKHDKLPDLMQDVGHLLVKATRRFTTTQLILAAGALTIGAVLLARYNDTDEFEFAD